MLIARTNKGVRIAAKNASRNEMYYCPGCHERLILKKGSVKVAHFSHGAHSLCRLQEEPETAEHLSGKWQLAQMFNGDLEVYLPEISQRPDVLFRSKKHRSIALEFQCSNITQQSLSERNAGYQRVKIHPIWLLGEHFRTHIQSGVQAAPFLTYTKKAQWGLRFWRVDQKRLELWHHIRVDWLNHLSVDRSWWDGSSWQHEKRTRFPSLKTQRNQLNKQIIMGLKSKNARFLIWQKYCYLRRTILQNLPEVCWPKTLMPPVLGASVVIWRKLLLTQVQTMKPGKRLSMASIWRWAQQAFDLTDNNKASKSREVLKARYVILQYFLNDLKNSHLLLADPRHGYRTTCPQS